jgi:hypothetical protein
MYYEILHSIFDKEEKEVIFYLILGYYIYNFMFKINGLSDSSDESA